MLVNFIDLESQFKEIGDEINKRIQDVLSHQRFILGPEVVELESLLADFGKAKYALSCANGTDALKLPLMAWGIGPGDAVFCPSFTYCASAESIAALGASPVFVDIDRQTYNISAASLERAIQDVLEQGDLTPRAVMSVDLFGQSADYEKIAPITRAHGLKLIADSAQGFGSTLNGKHPLEWADVTATSFYPAKPLGCYGDGGAMLTNDAELAGLLDSLRVHGRGTDKYDNVHIGLNSRLDTLQAAILIPKLAIFRDEIQKRQAVAQRYIEGLNGHVLRVPHLAKGASSTWAQFTIEVQDPQKLMDAFSSKSIPSARYYPKPVHLQTAYTGYPSASDGLSHTEDCMGKTVSLPMNPYLNQQVQDVIIEAVKAAS